MTTIELIDYSARSFAVAGDTRPIKSILKSAGGKFNPRLIDPTSGQMFAGWIFSAHRLSTIEVLLTGNGISFKRRLPQNINSSNYTTNGQNVPKTAE